MNILCFLFMGFMQIYQEEVAVLAGRSCNLRGNVSVMVVRSV